MNKPFHIQCHVSMCGWLWRVDVQWLAYVYVDTDINIVLYQDDQKELLCFAYTRSQLLGKVGPHSNSNNLIEPPSNMKETLLVWAVASASQNLLYTHTHNRACQISAAYILYPNKSQKQLTENHFLQLRLKSDSILALCVSFNEQPSYDG